MSSHIWTKTGPFEVARSSGNLLARTASFDEAFREFARGLRARWDGQEKAWVFKADQEQEVVLGLEQIAAEKTAAATRHASASLEIATELRENPFFFHSPKLNIELDLPGAKFVVRFPYNDTISQRLRHVGGRWCPETRSYAVPLSALETLRDITAEPRRENQLFQERNASFSALEAAAPLGAWMDAHPVADGCHRIGVKADPLGLTYKITFPFSLDSVLGQELIRAPLADAGALGNVRPSDADRMYPRVNLNSAIFEFCQRPFLEAALRPILRHLDSLGPCLKIELDASSTEGLRWKSQCMDPQAGELVLRAGKAWLVAKAQRTKNKTILKVHPLSASVAQAKIDRLHPIGQRRVCDMSGIDFEALGAHVEALILNEVSSAPRPEEPPAKKMRL